MADGSGLEVLGIAGSPRRHGNSETLLDRALAGAESAGAKITKIVLNDLKIGPCQNCGYCTRTGHCRIDDDMRIVYEALDRADRIALASPIFFTSVTAQTKIMVDRCQPYWARKFVLKLPPVKTGRAGLFLSVGGFKQGEKFFDCARFLVNVWMINLDVKLADTLFCPGVDAFGAINERAECLETAYGKGKTLVGE
jgi:multimeric flavodoxin WrbA